MTFINKLKEDTLNSVTELMEGNIKCKVISGDNPLTTI